MRAGTVAVLYLPRTRYREALALQRRLHTACRNGAGADVLILTEHEAVLTLGKHADSRFLRIPVESLHDRGVDLVETERGGDITYHGPGQLVAYPLLNLRHHGQDVHLHVRRLEETAIRLLDRYGVPGHRLPGKPGVWVGDAKIASVGVFVSRWTTMHGVAINIAPDLDGFELIHPCGLIGVRITSLLDLCGVAPPLEEAACAYASIFEEVFDVTLIEGHLTRIEAGCAPPPTRSVRPPDA